MGIPGAGIVSNVVISGGTLNVQGGIVSGSVAFAGTGGMMLLNGDLAPGTVVSGFATGDTIDLAALGYDIYGQVVSAGNELQISENGATTEISIAGDFTGEYFHLTPDPTGGTDITEDQTPCYCRGTLIRAEGGEVAVEDLKIGDRVMTISGEAKPIKWIGRRSYAGRFLAGNRDVLPIRIVAGALADGVPARDLWVSPEHALYLRGVLIPARSLVNEVTIIQAEVVDAVEYFHIELERHDVILAEGAPAESFVDDDSRFMFHNATDYYARYPEAVRMPPVYCALRVEDGLALELLRHELLVRARHLGGDGRQKHAKSLQGSVDRVTHQRIEGWAFDPASPETPVAVDVLANGVEIARIVADRYRADLDEAGIGDGSHAFELVVPGGLARDVRLKIELGFEADRTALPGSPVVLEAVTAPQPGGGRIY